MNDLDDIIGLDPSTLTRSELERQHKELARAAHDMLAESETLLRIGTSLLAALDPFTLD